MFMQYQGGGISHTSTREATNKFLLNCNQLDMANGEESHGIENDLDAEEGDHVMADVGHVSGGDNADGSTGDGDGDGDEIGDDEEDNYYHYEKHADDDKNSEEKPDLADNSLGPKDGEGEGDETYLALQFCRAALYIEFIILFDCDVTGFMWATIVCQF